MPLGMNDTSFTIDDDKRARLAHNYSRDPVSGITSLADAPEKTIYAPGRKFLSGGGGLLSTMGDYLKFCEMMRRHGVLNGARILGRKTVAYMTSNHLPNGETLMDRASGSFSKSAMVAPASASAFQLWWTRNMPPLSRHAGSIRGVA